MSGAPTLAQGMKVRVRVLGAGDDWAYGTVVIQSANGISAAILLDDFLRVPAGVLRGVLLLTIDERAGKAIGALDGNEYEVEGRVSGPLMRVN